MILAWLSSSAFSALVVISYCKKSYGLADVMVTPSPDNGAIFVQSRTSALAWHNKNCFRR